MRSIHPQPDPPAPEGIGDHRAGKVALTRPGWRTIGYVLVALLTLAFVAGNRSQIPEAWNVLSGASKLWLLLALACSIGGVANLGLLYGAGQRAAGMDVDISLALRVGAAAHFLNLISKSGGLAGLTVFLADARRRSRPRGPTAAAYLLAAVLGELAFAGLLTVAIILIAVDGRLTAAESIAVSVFAATALLRITAVIAALRSRTVLRWLLAAPRRLQAVVLRRDRPPPNHQPADELYDAVSLLRSQPMAALPAVLHAITTEVIGVTMLWVVLGAVHAGRTATEAIIGYAISVLFEILGFLPGGLGTVEVSLGALLVSFGLPVSQAAAAVALYRIGDLWLPMAIGALAGRRLKIGWNQG